MTTTSSSGANKEVSPVVIGIAVVLLLGGIIWGFVHFSSPRPPADFKYTPGKPPWADPKYSGPKEGRGFDAKPAAPAGTAPR